MFFSLYNRAMENFDQTLKKLKILTDAAKYDVSCSSSGHERRGKSGQMGSAAAMGVCHSWTADGRCISLLKVLYTNRCVYDCAYCVNRRSAQVERASFTCRELADITMEFYRRNYIEGLFLSSAVDESPDKTTEEIYESLRILREEYGFLGYIHAKIIPGVSAELLQRIGLLADRLSVNIEFPTREGLERLAPQKKPEAILKPMKQITETMAEQRALVGAGNKYSHYRYRAPVLEESAASKAGSYGGNAAVAAYGQESRLVAPNGKALTLRQDDARMAISKQRFSPAGQTTQLMIGATEDSDLQILNLSHSMYKKFFMRRVYFSAYIPLLESPLLPPVGSTVPLTREHRLYQADWLMRFYGFTADEIVDKGNPNLDLELDPKISWALRHLELFPMEINKVTPEELLRIPGIGNVSALRILRQRKYASLGYDDLKRIGVVLKRAKYFITVKGKYFGASVQEQNLREHLLMQTGGIQLDMLSQNVKLLES
ncbi:MAG: putative DNA modification/repair radical SAM protein [Clostridia bacterium]|nr:putative DNA modification/repair radical SAM protein [Clostridia bacterium]